MQTQFCIFFFIILMIMLFAFVKRLHIRKLRVRENLLKTRKWDKHLTCLNFERVNSVDSASTLLVYVTLCVTKVSECFTRALSKSQNNMNFYQLKWSYYCFGTGQNRCVLFKIHNINLWLLLYNTGLKKKMQHFCFQTFRLDLCTYRVKVAILVYFK